jgi:lysozyme family protein
MTSFEKALKVTLAFEGGYSNDQDDAGGATRFGIIESEARRHGYFGDMKDFPYEWAIKIYKSDYWDENKLDDIAQWHEPVALELFDSGVNMGVKTAAKFFQTALNVANRNQKNYDNLVVDGNIGLKTLQAMKCLGTDKDAAFVLKLLNIQQGARYIQICQNNETQEKFLRGWLQRCTI